MFFIQPKAAGSGAEARLSKEPPLVAHFADVYYRVTENWIQTQIQHLIRYKSIVLARRTANVNPSAAPTCYAIYERSRIEFQFNRVYNKLFKYYPSFLLMCRYHKARIIHAHFGYMGYAALPLAKAAGLPLVTTVYGWDVSQLPKQDPRVRQQYRDLFHYGSRFLAEGHYMGQQLKNLGCPSHKILVHHLGIDLNEFPHASRYLMDGEPLKILVAGRFIEKKGIVYAIEALSKLLASGVDARLTIIGDADQTEESQNAKRDILDAVERHRVATFVDLRGLQPHHELRRAYYEHHIFLSPSVQASDGNNEGGAPVSIIEASATGMPIVATFHCDIPEVVVHGSTGLLAPERDSEALAAHLRSFAVVPRQLQDMGAAGRRHVETEYDAAKQGEQLAIIYDNVCIQGSYE